MEKDARLNKRKQVRVEERKRKIEKVGERGETGC
jgi:hypothetical protein